MKKLMLIVLLGATAGTMWSSSEATLVPYSPRQVTAQKFLDHFDTLARASTKRYNPYNREINQLAYDMLGANERTPRPELIKKWRTLALQWHPDKAAPADKLLYTRVFQVINNAHQALGLDKGV